MTIDEILQQVYGQTLAPADAKPLILEHLDAMVDRCDLAAKALSGMLATGIKPPSKDSMAREAIEWADCLVSCSKTEPEPAP